MDTGDEEDLALECYKDYDMSVSLNDKTDDITYMHTGFKRFKWIDICNTQANQSDGDIPDNDE